MKYADSMRFKWNYELTLSTGEKVSYHGHFGDIYEMQEILEKHNLTISDSTLYKMRKPNERIYLVEPFLKSDGITDIFKEEIGSIQNIAEYHLKIGRYLYKDGNCDKPF